jgi:hypothetical protein
MALLHSNHGKYALFSLNQDLSVQTNVSWVKYGFEPVNIHTSQGLQEGGSLGLLLKEWESSNPF